MQTVGSGLIYAAIIVMWALYFIPRWLRRHEELSESRSVEKFDHAMRILSRREPTPDQRYIVMPPRPAEESPPSRRASSRRASSRRASSLAVRRRRVLAGLLLLTVALAAAAPFTVLPWWAPVLLAFLDVGDLAHLRAQERRRRELSRTRVAVRRRTRSRLRRFDSAERIVEARRVLAERRAAAEAERVEAEWAEHEATRIDAERLAADAMGWQPTPVPLPTYVTKPVATRTARPMVAPSAADVFDQTSAAGEPVPAAAASYDDYTAELDEILERRRAVND